MTTPAFEQQVAFLGNLQRLLAEGSFVATYKHALLLALSDLSVELGDDSGAPLPLPVAAICEKIVISYWRQAVAYPVVSGPGGVLKQNTGKQAAIIRLVAVARAGTVGSLAAAKTKRETWTKLIADVTDVVKTMPLWKLQRVGDGVLDFLYANVGSGNSIELRPGVAYCFRRFHGLVEDVVRGAWVRFVRGLRENQPLLGDSTNLDEFLFGSERADLSVYRPILVELQAGLCFYCERRLDAVSAVDHFIPWSRYPVDLGHNFVLAHGSCNGKKGDRLAAFYHLGSWIRRNHEHGNTLDERFVRTNVFADRIASMQITRWAYEQLEATNGLVWLSGEKLVPLDTKWRELLIAA